MTEERNQQIPFGEVVKARCKGAIRTLPTDSPWLPLHVALWNQIPKIEWTRVQPEAEINGVIGSTFASLHYAHIKTGRPYLQNFGVTDPKHWDAVFDNVLNHKEMTKIFYENLCRPHITVIPSRGVPIQYILKDAFAGKEDLITGVDLGAGIGIALPLLNSPLYAQADFPHKDLLLNKFGGDSDVQVSYGVSVDRQNWREDRDWVKASIWPDAKGVTSFEQIDDLFGEALAEDKVHNFPFLTHDVLADDCFERIKRELQKANHNTPVDFVVTSYLRYQLGSPDSLAQGKLLYLINSLLKEGGIWIDMGEELLTNEGAKTKSKVVVYKKVDDALQRQGVPFVLKYQNEIETVDLDYFHI